ncbi:hypothetical protein Hdeb2414_s0012g00382671 [Helianthus debilis subsp. tardiflorus]
MSIQPLVSHTYEPVKSYTNELRTQPPSNSSSCRSRNLTEVSRSHRNSNLRHSPHSESGRVVPSKANRN